jgi:hypothetical protein
VRELRLGQAIETSIPKLGAVESPPFPVWKQCEETRSLPYQHLVVHSHHQKLEGHELMNKGNRENGLGGGLARPDGANSRSWKSESHNDTKVSNYCKAVEPWDSDLVPML